ncbi:hypothetical protein CDAR_388881 [Caerostris darwini]|uniref:Uncharacterized protein n=1 Tax=Caerostris darwini TaxID=1538125 RepID=A0AAV4S2X1_9ARAC|nr:hypothetical protein CDAR_388881 [Caerostris darwini]
MGIEFDTQPLCRTKSYSVYTEYDQINLLVVLEGDERKERPPQDVNLHKSRSKSSMQITSMRKDLKYAFFFSWRVREATAEVEDMETDPSCMILGRKEARGIGYLLLSFANRRDPRRSGAVRSLRPRKRKG